VQVSYLPILAGVPGPLSEALSLQVLALPASALSELIILEAANGGAGPEFDVSGATTATLRVGVWPLIAEGQPVWLSLTGINQNGSAYSKLLLSPPNGVDASWAASRSKTVSVAGAELKNLRDSSSLTVTLKVAVAGGTSEAGAVVFAPRTYAVKSVVDSRPMITSVRDSKDEIGNGGNTFDTSVTLTGTASPNQSVQIFDNGAVTGTAPVSSSGTWTYGFTGLGAGSHSVTAKALYGSGLVSAARIFNRLADTRPAITNVQDSRGSVSNGGNTFDTSVTVSGTALGNQSVQILDGGTVKGTVTVSSDGGWTYGLTGLAVGSHSLTARAVYGSSLVSNTRSFTRSQPLVIDTSRMVLSGGHVHMVHPADWRTTNNYLAGVQLRRRASAGTGNIQYRSANAQIASVDGDGLVTSQGNGSAQIIVTDSSGSTASYTVDCSNNFWVDSYNAGLSFNHALQYATDESYHPFDYLQSTGRIALNALKMQYRVASYREYHTGQLFNGGLTNMIRATESVISEVGPIAASTAIGFGLRYKLK
jgi:hypothetical protein